MHHTLARSPPTCTSATVDPRIQEQEERVATTMANMVRATRKIMPCLHRLIPKRPPRPRQLMHKKTCTGITPWAATVQCGPLSPSASPTAAPVASLVISPANGSCMAPRPPSTTAQSDLNFSSTRLRHPFRHRIPILQYRAHVRRLP